MFTVNTAKTTKFSALFVIATIAILATLVVMSMLTAATTPASDGLNPYQFLGQFQPRQFPNERPPLDDQVVSHLNGIPLDASPAEVQALLDEWYKDFYHKNEKSGPNPIAYAERMKILTQAEAQGLSPLAMNAGISGTAKMLMIPIEFNGTDEIAACDPVSGTFAYTDTVTGPLNGTIPDPRGHDNFSIWSDDFSVQWYEDLMFGNGVGLILTGEQTINNGAGVDLTGVSAANWYLEQSEGAYTLTGEIYPDWVQLDHSVAYYGWDGDETNPAGDAVPCDGTPSGYGFEFVIDTIHKINEADPNFDWAQYDVDGDGVVDHLMVIHAGTDNSAGGGDMGNYQLWAHSWDVYCDNDGDNRLDYGCVADDGGTPDNPDDDILVGNYTHIPEDADIGVVVHEYGHDIGLPDYYDTSGATSNSTAHWINMSAGSWSGDLGGSHPAPFNPWGRYFFGWEDPVRIPYTDTLEVEIGQSDPTPFGTEDSVWIDLPDQSVTVDNLAGTGNGLHSILGNNLDSPLEREFDLSSATAPVLTFNTSFVIEEDWDYTYVLASVDDGTSWDVLLNEEGIYGTEDPNSTFTWQGVGGLTGEYDGLLTYDLSAYAGEASVWIQLLYATDAAYQDPGIWVDDFSLDDGETSLHSCDFETDHCGWTNTGWEEVPYQEFYEHYYMLEWRNDSGSIASHGQTKIYQFVQYDDDGKFVDQFPANVPGMLVWYRNNFYENNNVVAGGRESHFPAMGPKGELLLVDSHFDPVNWSGGWWDAGSLSNRRGAMDGAFGLNPVPAWMIHDEGDNNNALMDFGSRPAIVAFHDSMGYAPGWLFPGDGYVYKVDNAASVVIPAQDVYSTRIRSLDDNGNPGNDVTGFWGYTVGGQPLGPGNPGYYGVQFGVHAQVVAQASDGSSAVVKIWNDADFIDVETSVDKSEAFPGDTLTYTTLITNSSPLTQTVSLVYQADPSVGGLTQLVNGVPGSLGSFVIGPNSSKSTSFAVTVDLATALGTTVYGDVLAEVSGHYFDVMETGAETTIISPVASRFGNDTSNNVVNAGNQIAYTQIITNTDDRAIDLLLYTPIPTNTTYVAGSASGGVMPVGLSMAEVEALIAKDGFQALAKLTPVAPEDATALLWSGTVAAGAATPEMGWSLYVNDGQFDGTVDVTTNAYDNEFANWLATLTDSVTIVPVSRLYFPLIFTN